MSGSESSAPDAAAKTDALRMTVYDLGAGPAVDAGAGAAAADVRRSGRIKMFLVLAACAAPVIASYFAFFIVRPEARSNYGTLIQPTRSMPDVAVRGLDGAQQPLRSLAGQWLLVVVAPGGCDGRCERLLYAQRQLREMLGRDRDRVDKVWLVTDEAPVAPALAQAVQARPSVQVLRWPREGVSRWLEADRGQALEDHLYLVDPMGEWMMRFPASFEPAAVKRDLERVLRASAFWDRPGR